MDDDIRKSLLTKKSLPFDKLHEECLIKLQRMKQKNDFMQRQIGTEIQETMKDEVRRQKQFLQREIKEIKDLMTQMTNRFKDPESRNRLKNIKMEAQKQIERNKVILKDMISKSFLSGSYGERNHNEDMGQYLQGGKVQFAEFGDSQHKDPNFKKESVLTEENQEIEIDYEIEKKILDQKTQMLNDVQQSTLRVNEIMNDMAVMVDQQGEGLDIISEELVKTHSNVVASNDTMEQASLYQKKSRKKYIVFAMIIILLVAAVVGIVFILK